MKKVNITASNVEDQSKQKMAVISVSDVIGAYNMYSLGARERVHQINSGGCEPKKSIKGKETNLVAKVSQKPNMYTSVNGLAWTYSCSN